MRSLAFTTLTVGAVAQVFNVPYAIPPTHGDLPPLPSLSKRRTFQPCAEVAELWAAQKAQKAPSIRVPAERAYDCLQSVPVDVKGDVKQIQELKSYLEYQSTLAWLKSGVKGQLDPLDIMGGLDTIAKGVQSGAYKSDYEVQYKIRSFLDSAGDFHLQYIPEVTVIFQFSRPGGSLVSISEDGLSLPKLYFKSDLPTDVNGKITGSAIVKINGKNATEYLQELSDGTKYHDADTRYNTVFANPALEGLGTDSGGLTYTHYKYLGPTTTYTFANGTDKTIENVAFIPPIFDFTKVTDGASFFKKFCTGPSQAQPTPTKPATRPASTPTARPSPSLVGYPKPIFIQSSKVVSGYYMSENNYKDTAVLVLPAFNPAAASQKLDSLTAGFVEAQSLLRSFFADAVKQNKKKLVIDLRGNGGGTIDMGFELFKQLFPKIEPYGAARYRAHDAFHYYSALVADVAVEGKSDGKYGESWDDADYGIQSTFLWSNILDENLQKYKTYKDYYGPKKLQGDTFTSVRRYNFSNNLGGHTLEASLTGYNEFRNAPAQPFTAENIIILQDGFCGSTCAIFSELMREQGKVQTIAIGGRPQNAPMQGVGGSKGSQKLDMDSLYHFAERTIEIAAGLDGIAVAKRLNETNVGNIYNARQIAVRSAPAEGTDILGAINSLNNQRFGDATETPLEFIYEAADCRLFYTTKSYLDPVNLWKQAIDAKWGSGKCVPGSTGHSTAIGVLEKKPFANKSNGQGGDSNTISIGAEGAAASVRSYGAVVVVLIAAFVATM